MLLKSGLRLNNSVIFSYIFFIILTCCFYFSLLCWMCYRYGRGNTYSLFMYRIKYLGQKRFFISQQWVIWMQIYFLFLAQLFSVCKALVYWHFQIKNVLLFLKFDNILILSYMIFLKRMVIGRPELVLRAIR